MQFDNESRKLGGGRTRAGSRAQSIFLKLLAVCASAVLLVSAIVLSLVLFAGVVAAILILGVYVWWKTRRVRAEIEAAQRDTSVIEGEVIRKEIEDDTRRP